VARAATSTARKLRGSALALLGSCAPMAGVVRLRGSAWDPRRPPVDGSPRTLVIPVALRAGAQYRNSAEQGNSPAPLRAFRSGSPRSPTAGHSERNAHRVIAPPCP